MEVDRRRLYLGEGFSSLFTYCMSALHLSEHAAYGRIEAARAARRFPIILELLHCGDITLTAIGLLRPHLTAENHRDVLDRARHQPKQAIELIVAALHPRPDAPTIVRGVRTPNELKSAESPATASQSTTVEPPANARRYEVKPLTPERYKIQFTVDRATYEQLRRVQDLMRHALPSGDPAVIFARALAFLAEHLERAKLAKADTHRTPRAANAISRHIPAGVRRTVWRRDGGRCAFEGTRGRCTETGLLEFHHVKPFANGGAATAENIELRCRAHNVYEADQYFGPRDGRFSREQDDAL
jgi:hypothetical protein